MEEKDEKIMAVFLVNCYEHDDEDFSDENKFIHSVNEVTTRNGYAYSVKDILRVWHGLIDTYIDILERGGEGSEWKYFKFMSKHYDPRKPVFSGLFTVDMVHVMIECILKHSLKLDDDLDTSCINDIRRELLGKTKRIVSEGVVCSKWKTLKKEFSLRVPSAYLSKLDQLFVKNEEKCTVKSERLSPTPSEESDFSEPDNTNGLTNNDVLNTLKTISELTSQNYTELSELKQLTQELLAAQHKTNKILANICGRKNNVSKESNSSM